MNASAADHLPTAGHASTAQRPPRLLVIDDDPTTVEHLQAVVPRWEVVGAQDALLGLDLLRRAAATGRGWDLVVLDIGLPRLDGYGACAQIRQAAPQLPILPFSASADDPLLAAYMAAWGCAPVLRKDANPATIRERLLGALNTVPAVVPGALQAYIQRQAAQAEAAARQANARRLLAFATNPFDLVALTTLLDQPELRVVAGAYHWERLVPYLHGTTVDGLVLTTRAAASLATPGSIPLPALLIAADLDDAWAWCDANTAAPPAAHNPVYGIAVADSNLGPTLPHILAQLHAGQPYRDPRLAISHDQAVVLLPHLRTALAPNSCSLREAEMLLLAAAGLDDAAICAAVTCPRSALFKLRTRLYPTLGAAHPADLRRWLRHWFAAQW